MANFYGNSGNNLFFGTSFADNMYGYDGNDTLYGFDGNDFLQGGNGADWLDGGNGIDTVDYNGAAGVYVDLASGYGYYGEAAGDRLFNIENVQGTGGYGDTLYGSAVANVLSGYGGNDYLYGRDGNDTLYGMTGNDFLQGGNGADWLDGGDGVDTVDYNGTTGVYVNLATGYGYYGEAAGDRLFNIENVQGTGGYGDTLIGSAADNVLSGYGGDDFLQGGAGADTLYGGSGTDTADYNGTTGVYVNLATGYGYYGEAAGDRLYDIENVQGTGGYGDSLIGSAANNVLSGYGGDDFLQGGAGADTLYGGSGIDTADYNGTAGVYIDLASGYGYYGEAAGDRLYDIENVQGTGGYADYLYGSAVANVLSGYGGNDYLYGRDGNDTLNGMDGNDFLQGGNGADTLNGGTGIDTIDYNGAAGVYVNLATGQGFYGEAAGDVISGVENVQGTTGYGDTLIGSADANVLSGYGGADGLYGGDGNDTLNGMDGDDFLQGGNGADTLNGGAGIDTIDYNGAAGVSVNLTTGVGVGGEAQGDVISGVENVQGTSGYNDVLIGSADANILSGYGGGDTLDGQAGNDTLNGMDGNDILRGGVGADHIDGGAGIDTAMYSESASAVLINLAAGTAAGGNATGDVLVSVENLYGSSFNDALLGDGGANTLVGNAGNDVLAGLGGQDILAGGAGADRFVYGSVGQSLVASADRITDFSHAQGDRIDLVGIDANTTVAGDQAFNFIGAGAFTHHAGELHATVSGGFTVVSGDVNGDAVADFAIVLTGAMALVAADFML
ncbi:MULTISPECIES: calcium-binding protein [Inquilinus]|uniref:Ca2+-binding RTX toxin-like protein n=1 Tax=Inquilinus ginsengisoli TaxID=363840 RepID=A0ABU1JXW5_9PROT|nr:calcium-binding protein [Inquilinus ginsengisoli]MDR6293465.1 Ca2+-binding RTX toxin-like protein [Inquilinus ginsengisoli]